MLRVLRSLAFSLLLCAPTAFSATVTHEAATADTDATPNTSGAFTPVSGDLLIVGVCGSGLDTAAGSGADDTVPLTSSIGGFTFTQVFSQGFASATHGTYVYVADALVSDTSSQTVTFTPATTGTGTHIMVAAVVGITKDGLDAILQTANGTTIASSTPETIFGASALTGNPTFAFLCNQTNPAGVTEPSGWTERADIGYASPNVGGEYSSRNSGFTGTTITWGSTTSSLSGNVAVEIDSSSAAPTFTAAPAIGTRTTSAIPITFTSDTTGTVYGGRLTDGSGTPTCDALEANTATGGVQYFSEAVVATVGDTEEFGSITDGTVTDGYFCIEDGSSNDSAVASIANMYKIPAFTTALTIASQTSTAYTSNSKVLDGPGSVFMAAVPKDASAPSTAQCEAQTGGGIVASTGGSDDATGTQTLTISAANPFPLHDVYYCGTYGSQHEANPNLLADEFLDPQSGEQFLTLASVDADSPCFGQTPAVVAGDVLVMDTLSSPGSYAVTQFDTCLFSVAAGGDLTRQLIDFDLYDVSLAAYYGAAVAVINNLAPNVVDIPEAEDVFFNDALYRINTNPDVDLSELSEDAEGDDIDFTVTAGALPTDWVLTAETGVLSDGIPGDCTPGGYTFDITMTDTYGATTVVANTVSIGDLVPDVVTGGVSEAAAIAAIEAVCTLDAIAGTPTHSGPVAIGDVVYTSPVAGTLVEPTAQITYSLSLGPGSGSGRRTLRLGLGIR